jgi:hypothetical protein
MRKSFLSPEIRRLGGEADHSPPSNDRVKAPLHLHDMHKDNLIFYDDDYFYSKLLKMYAIKEEIHFIS